LSSKWQFSKFRHQNSVHMYYLPRPRHISYETRHSRIISEKSPSFCMKTLRASLTNLAALLPHSHDRSCYVSRPILAPPPFRLQKLTDLHEHDFAHSPTCDISLGWLRVPGPEAGDFVELLPLRASAQVQRPSAWMSLHRGGLSGGERAAAVRRSKWVPPHCTQPLCSLYSSSRHKAIAPNSLTEEHIIIFSHSETSDDVLTCIQEASDSNLGRGAEYHDVSL